MDKILRQIFENIFWPAAAGNVIWAFCNLALDNTDKELSVLPRVAILLVFSFYLIIGWLQLRASPGAMTARYWVFEALHIMTIAFSAIAAQVSPLDVPNCMRAYFAVVIIGHLTCSWKYSGDTYRRCLVLAGVNIVGALFLEFGGRLGLAKDVVVATSFVIALLLWMAIGRRKEFHRIATALPH